MTNFMYGLMLGLMIGAFRPKYVHRAVDWIKAKFAELTDKDTRDLHQIPPKPKSTITPPPYDRRAEKWSDSPPPPPPL